MVPFDSALPSPVSICARSPTGSVLPNWNCARRRHGVAGDDVLGHRVLHESVRRDHFYLAGCGVLRRHHALGAAEMIGMAVGVDHRGDGFCRAVGEIKIERGLRGLVRQQRIDQDQPAVAFDDGHVGDVEAAHLVDAVGDLEQAVDRVELRLPPQARIDRRRHLVLLQERIGFCVERRPAAGPGDHAIRQRGDKPAFGVVEIGAVGKRQRFDEGVVGRAGGGFGVAGLGEKRLRRQRECGQHDRNCQCGAKLIHRAFPLRFLLFYVDRTHPIFR